MTLFDRLSRREAEAADELPAQASDDELLAWGEQLRSGDETAAGPRAPRHMRPRPLRADPVEPVSGDAPAEGRFRPAPADRPFPRVRRGRPLAARPAHLRSR